MSQDPEVEENQRYFFKKKTKEEEAGAWEPSKRLSYRGEQRVWPLPYLNDKSRDGRGRG